jgi:predicted AAA+ superfamily ATPase
MVKDKTEKLTAVEFMKQTIAELAAINESLKKLVQCFEVLSDAQSETVKAIKVIVEKGVITRAR